MSLRSSLLFLLLIPVLSACVTVRPAPIYSGPLIGDSVHFYHLPFPVNTPAHELFGTISGDGRWLYFGRRPVWDTTWLYRTAIEPGRRPVVAGAVERILTAATRLYFPTPIDDSGRYVVVGCDLPDTKGGCDLYDIQLNQHADLLSFANIDTLNTEGWESTPHFSRTRMEIWFTQWVVPPDDGRKDGILDRVGPSLDLMVSKLGTGGWSSAISAGDSINTGSDETSPSLGFNDSVLFFISDRPGGIGEGDVYVSFRGRDGKWGSPFNLGPRVNSRWNENSVYVLPDNRHLLISSERKGEGSQGGADLYVVDLYFDLSEE